MALLMDITQALSMNSPRKLFNSRIIKILGNFYNLSKS